MKRREFIKKSGKALIVTSTFSLIGIVSGCVKEESDSDDCFHDGYYSEGYYTGGYYAGGYFVNQNYYQGYFYDGYYDCGY